LLLIQGNTVKITRDHLRRRIRRELGLEPKGQRRTVRVTRSELNQILLEEFSLSGIGSKISSGVSAAAEKVKSLAAGGEHRSQVAASSEDAVKLHDLLSQPAPDEVAIERVMAHRMADLPQLSQEWDQLMVSMGKADTLVSAFKNSSVADAHEIARALQAQLAAEDMRRRAGRSATAFRSSELSKYV
jgi:hypothetical protein